MTSVLVAVYNSENTLRRCLDSLLCQSLRDVQIICIDDASTDGSPIILKEYSDRYDNIEVVYLSENHGQGYARNQGLPLIRGEYTAVLDSDDYFAPDALEKVENVFLSFDDTDCVLLDVQYLFPDGTVKPYRTKVPEVISGREACIKSLTWDIHGWYVVRSSILRQYPFDDSCHSYSDDNSTPEQFIHSRMVRSCDAKYYFVQSPDSCTRGISIYRFDYLKAMEILSGKLVGWGLPDDVIRKYEFSRYVNLLGCVRLYYWNNYKFTEDDQKCIKDILHGAWKSIDRSCIHFDIRFKPACMPLHPFWHLFLFQEKLYCLLFDGGRNK